MQNAPVPESDRRLRIVTPRFGEAVVGGAEAVARDLALRLAAAGWRVEVLTTCAVEAVTWANRLPAGTALDGPVTVHRHPTRLRRPPRLFHQLSRALFRLPLFQRDLCCSFDRIARHECHA